jgi:hypothetical protein
MIKPSRLFKHLAESGHDTEQPPAVITYFAPIGTPWIPINSQNQTKITNLPSFNYQNTSQIFVILWSEPMQRYINAYFTTLSSDSRRVPYIHGLQAVRSKSTESLVATFKDQTWPAFDWANYDIYFNYLVSVCGFNRQNLLNACLSHKIKSVYNHDRTQKVYMCPETACNQELIKLTQRLGLGEFPFRLGTADELIHPKLLRKYHKFIDLL